MTYSIVARDEASGEIGVAVQTCNLAVGTWVPWAESGVGAVATQSHADRTYGTLGLALMRAAKSAQDALTALMAADSRVAFRQVAMVDSQGRVAVHTGSRCLPEAGHYLGQGFSTQANMMTNPTVWSAMAEAYLQATGDLAARLVTALDAAEAEGGDIRGRQSAALLVVGPQSATFPVVDLRVDRHPEPLIELRRMLRLHRAYAAEYVAAESVANGEYERVPSLLDEIATGAPEQGYLQFLRSYHLARIGHSAEGLDLMRALIEANPLWEEYLRRDVQTDTFDNPGLAQQMLAALRLDQKSTLT
ncbi:MAG: DUF1028 domain-containing protein [Caldilineaceae bacterium]